MRLLMCAAAVMMATLAASPLTAVAAGDPNRGAAAFQVCASCHSVEPGMHLTGPSLGHVWGSRAGTAQGFHRYSEPLQHSAIVWNEQSLERWLTNPQAMVPGTAMTFAGVQDARMRADIIAYLHAVSEGKAPKASSNGTTGRGMMGGSAPADLRSAGPNAQVTSLRHCGDTYIVRTADGKVRKFWEYNVRLKTDSGPNGPAGGKPVITESGMRGDRISIVFGSPKQIGDSIQESCD